MRNSLTARLARKRRDRRITHKERQSRRTLGLVTSLIVGGSITLIMAVVAGGAALLGVYWYFARTLPPPEDIIKAREQFETTLIYDRSGQTVLYQVIDPLNGDRQWTPITDIPPNLINATIAIEDKSFWDNPGFDVRGISRALWLTITQQSVQGGSSITQQLVKNNLIPVAERASVSVDRKIKEVILAGEISRRYSKPQILELYLNTNFYGNLAYGIDAASRVYFGKTVQNLTLGEAAMLVAIPQNPQLNPLDAPQASRTRQIVVLEKMAEVGYITVEQARQAASEPVIVAPLAERYNLLAPHFSIFARQQAEQLLNARGLDGARLVSRSGLRIFTTLDLDLQYQSECVARGYINRIAGGDPKSAPNTSAGTPCNAAIYIPDPNKPDFKMNTRRNVTNASVVVMKPATGEIAAMVGSLDYWNPGIDGNFNVALSERQPGSTFKLFTYLSAFAQGMTPGQLVWDVPTEFDTGGGPPYVPTNEDRKFHGPMSIRTAFANSYNIPAVSVLSQVGIADVIRKAHLLGINSINGSLDQYGLSLTLGSAEVSLLDMTYAYGVFANMGVMAGTPTQDLRPGYRSLDPVAVLRIEDRDGNILWQYDQNLPTFGRRNIVPDALAYLMNNVLSDKEARLPAFGRGNPLDLTRPAAAKTGTTNDNRDSWTLGYTPQYVTGVWVGNNNNTPMGDDVSGSTGAAPIWHAVMEYAHNRDNLPVQAWERPATITEATVCRDTGLLPTAECPRVREIFYADGTTNTVPRTVDTWFKRFTINSRNGLIATANTPPELRTDKIYFDFPPEYRDWARTAGYEIPPTEFDTGGLTSARGGIGITFPASLSRVRGIVELRGNLENPDMVSYSVAYGAGLNPRDWTNISSGDNTTTGAAIALGRWNAGSLDGVYTVRLQVVLKDRSVIQDTKQFTVDNKPPTVRIASPTNGTTISGKITLEASARDNITDGLYVEFYAGDRLIGTVRAGQAGAFQFDWTPDRAGPVTFFAVAYDAAGNSVKSAGVSAVVN
jgi:membrane peptidoglycan carboxypeptidase